LALAIASAPQRWRNSLLLAICLPFWVSVLVRIFALQQILGRQGVINSSLGWLWEKAAIVLPLAPEFAPLPLLYSKTGVLLGLIYAFLPFGILPIYAAIARMDKRLLEASHDLGASAWYTTMRVIMPLARPGIVAGAVLIFVPALGAFFVSEIMGGPGDILIGNIIEFNFKAGNNWPFGAALSMAMLILAFVIFAIAFWKRDKSALYSG
jgi:spermidine/putrescine transport system permease protein